MLWNDADPTDLLDAHCIFNAGTVRFQLGTLTRVIPGWGPITVSSIGILFLVTEGNGHVDPVSLRLSLFT